MGSRPERSQRFADADAEQADAEWPRPIRARQWIGEDGVRWRLRGREIEAGSVALRRLLTRSGLRVLHVYGPRPREVTGQEREGLLERVGLFAAGEAPPHSCFWLAEFRSEDRQVMLIIEEGC